MKRRPQLEQKFKQTPYFMKVKENENNGNKSKTCTEKQEK